VDCNDRTSADFDNDWAKERAFIELGAERKLRPAPPLYFPEDTKEDHLRDIVEATEATQDLGAKQKQVLDALRFFPDGTNAEIAAHLKWPVNRITPRILELRTMELVFDAGRRRCRVTGSMAHAPGAQSIRCCRLREMSSQKSKRIHKHYSEQAAPDDSNEVLTSSECGCTARCPSRSLSLVTLRL
jgi:hypothetical protein